MLNGSFNSKIPLNFFKKCIKGWYCNDVFFFLSLRLFPIPFSAVDESRAYQAYIEYIDGLPVNPSPEIFGMHENANITCAQAETMDMLSTILALQPRSAGIFVSIYPPPKRCIAFHSFGWLHLKKFFYNNKFFFEQK